MVDYEINPTLIGADSEQEALVLELLLKNIGAGALFIKAGEYELPVFDDSITIKLTYHLLVRPRDKNQEQTRIEVLQTKSFSKGEQGSLFDSLGVLMPEQNYLFKAKEPGTNRVTKFLPYTNTLSLENIVRECSFTRMNRSLRCKKPVLTRSGGFLVMRRWGTMDLFDFIQKVAHSKNYLSFNDFLKLIRNILNAVKVMLDNGLSHGDLKPENILIDDKTLEVTLADYGFTCRLTESNELKKYRGTDIFIAPELVDGKTRTAKSDAYAVGMIMADLFGDRSLKNLSDKPTPEELRVYIKNRQWAGLAFLSRCTEEQQADLIHLMNQLTETIEPQRMDIPTALQTIQALSDYYTPAVVKEESNIESIRPGV